jgi:hypothetical protein
MPGIFRWAVVCRIETSVTNYQRKLHNIPEEQRPNKVLWPPPSPIRMQDDVYLRGTLRKISHSEHAHTEDDLKGIIQDVVSPKNPDIQ